jgi:hypothetical protein
MKLKTMFLLQCIKFSNKIFNLHHIFFFFWQVVILAHSQKRPHLQKIHENQLVLQHWSHPHHPQKIGHCSPLTEHLRGLRAARGSRAPTPMTLHSSLVNLMTDGQEKTFFVRKKRVIIVFSADSSEVRNFIMFKNHETYTAAVNQPSEISF